VRPTQPDADDAPLIALGEALVRTRAMESGLAYELIAARADLQRIVTAVREGEPEPEVRTLQGWRREVVGDELIELLHGRRALRVGPDHRVEIDG
jgi:ribonuclease D